MAQITSNDYYTEYHHGEGTAFSFKIKSKLHSEHSSLQKIEIFETEKFGCLMVIDDCFMLTSRDNFLYHEMISHTALFSHRWTASNNN
jgi:spermidine synthase